MEEIERTEGGAGETVDQIASYCKARRKREAWKLCQSHTVDN